MKNTFLILLILLSVVACKKDPVEKDTMNVHFMVDHRIGQQNVLWDTVMYTNAKNEVFETYTLKYFLSEIRLIAGADTVEVVPIHYIDGRESSTFMMGGEVPRKNYNAVGLVFGINKAMNTSGRFVDPPESFMEWPVAMGGGYHYMKFEGRFRDSNQVLQNFQMHTGPTMGNDYSVEHFFDLPIVEQDMAHVIITHHLDRWMTNPNDISLYDVTKIMGNPAMQEKLKANATDVIEVGLE